MRNFAVFIILFPVLFYLLTRNKNNSLFSPLNAYTLLYFVKIVLPVIIFSDVNNISFVEYDFLEDALLSDTAFLKYAILQSLGYILILSGVKFACRDRLIKANGCEDNEHVPYWLDNGSIIYLKGGLTFFLIGVIGFSLIMAKVGGLLYFMSNLQNRTIMVRDLDFQTYMLSFISYAPLLIIYAKRWTKAKIHIWEFAIVVLAGLMMGLGGRKPLIMLILECIFIYHFTVKKVKISEFVKVKYIVVLLFVYLFFTTFSRLRAEGAFEQFTNNPIEFYSENAGEVIENIATESYVPIFVSVVKHFDVYEKWHGSSYKGLITAFIPSSLYPNKPPVDDGMYLYSIACGNYNIKPPLPTEDLNITSWPLETFGAMYANFGIIGVLVGMLVLGLLLGVIFNKMIDSSFGFMNVTLYVIALTTLELSTLRIVQIITAIILLYFIQFIIEKFHKC